MTEKATSQKRVVSNIKPELHQVVITMYAILKNAINDIKCNNILNIAYLYHPVSNVAD
jgi:hypothetical protein